MVQFLVGLFVGAGAVFTIFGFFVAVGEDEDPGRWERLKRKDGGGDGAGSGQGWDD